MTRDYLLGLVTIPALVLVGMFLVVALERTSTFRLSCDCGADWGNPNERGWRIWWEKARMAVHNKTPRHRRWRRNREAL